MNKTATDSITLTVPPDPRLFAVVRLVVAGLATRLDLEYEHIDDLQLAAEAVLLAEPRVVGEEVTVALTVSEGALELQMGPLEEDAWQEHFRDSRSELGLRRLLSTLAGDIDFSEREGRQWLRFERRVP